MSDTAAVLQTAKQSSAEPPANIEKTFTSLTTLIPSRNKKSYNRQQCPKCRYKYELQKTGCIALLVPVLQERSFCTW